MGYWWSGVLVESYEWKVEWDSGKGYGALLGITDERDENY